MGAIGRGKGNNTKIHVAKTWIFLRKNPKPAVCCGRRYAGRARSRRSEMPDKEVDDDEGKADQPDKAQQHVEDPRVDLAPPLRNGVGVKLLAVAERRHRARECEGEGARIRLLHRRVHEHTDLVFMPRGNAHAAGDAVRRGGIALGEDAEKAEHPIEQAAQKPQRRAQFAAAQDGEADLAVFVFLHLGGVLVSLAFEPQGGVALKKCVVAFVLYDEFAHDLPHCSPK